MSIFSKRSTACVIAAVAIIGSTLYGAHKSLVPLVNETEDGFYSGVYSSEAGYTTKGIYSQLDMRTDAAMGLITKCGETEPELTDKLRDAREELLDAMSDGDISDMYDANKELQDAYSDLAKAISGTSLESDSAVEEYMSNFTGAQSVIDSSGYNASVRKLKSDTLSVFPANVFCEILDIDAPELFD